ncbi:hypothetical protein BDV25DRAFT_145458 [Aspergillus avenaceus]|uniref:Uncharacterized protein n=1 Tax=Aspergillus avenaceus TaxID=36643 RepID=A0A5N6TE02_ASPAV|nr:hypothetical protein BDV25DRAFT_145458 [Aspergillus avenaceus]
MASHIRPSSLVCLVLAILAFSSINHAQPISKSLEPRVLEARSPEPRMIPGSDDIVGDVLNRIGLEHLAKLNHWKENQDPDVIDDSHSATPTNTTHDNVTHDSTHGYNKHDESKVGDPAKDPTGFVSGVFDIVADRIREAFYSSDEHTLN